MAALAFAGPSTGSVWRPLSIVELPSCDVVIATKDRPDALARCLLGLIDQTHRDFGVVVVDDGSEVPLREVVEQARFSDLRCTVIRTENAGPASARNTGAGAATGDYLVFVDDDVLADRRLVEVHLRAVVQPHAPEHPIVSFGPFVQPADWVPTPWNLWEARQARKEAEAMLAGAYEPTWRQFHTGNNCVPRAAFEAAGGFDTDFKRAEDDEFALRLDDAGCVFRFEPSAIAWHYSVRTRRAWLDIPRAYARFDVEIDRMHPHTGYLDAKIEELEDRRLPLRLARRVFGGRAARLGIELATRSGAALYRLGRVDEAMGALSVAYDLSYVDSLRRARAAGGSA